MALFASRSQFDQLDQFSGSRHDLLRAEMASFREHTDERFDKLAESIEYKLVARLGKLVIATASVATALIGTLVMALAAID